jgi:EAL domain-containing protein (putative c-di-GMP-specific phosphodiesterase class I)
VADRVVLEITERSRATDVHSWEQAIAMLTELGFAIAVDDLGAGYSSLSVLAELKPQYIKVDMSIVRDVDSDPRKQRLIDLLSRFADATDSVLIAEGVETEAEARTVRTCGAHLIQGYLLGRPSFEMPALSYDAISGLTRNH